MKSKVDFDFHSLTSFNHKILTSEKFFFLLNFSKKTEFRKMANVKLTVDDFGTVEDHTSKELKQIKRFTWINSQTNVSVQVRPSNSSLTNFD